MVLSDADHRLIAAVQDGLPLVPRPFAAIGATVGLGEEQVIRRLDAMLAAGVIKRFGVVVRHHELGYRANAMVVWNIPDDRVAEVGRRLAECPCVTLCYQRPRRPPDWPYNLFCMVHGRDRAVVEAQVADMAGRLELDGVERALLFSGRRFKQRGARYGEPAAAE